MEPVNISGVYPLHPLLEFEPTQTEVHSTSLKPHVGVIILLAQLPAADPVDHGTPDSPSGQNDVLQPTASSLLINPSQATSQLPSVEDMMYATALELEVWKEEQKLVEKVLYRNGNFRRPTDVQPKNFPRRSKSELEPLTWKC